MDWSKAQKSRYITINDGFVGGESRSIANSPHLSPMIHISVQPSYYGTCMLKYYFDPERVLYTDDFETSIGELTYSKFYSNDMINAVHSFENIAAKGYRSNGDKRQVSMVYIVELIWYALVKAYGGRPVYKMFCKDIEDGKYPQN